MKMLTLWQPWASLMAYNLKRFETRSWPTKYRGPLLIHAAKRPFIAADGSKILCPVGWTAWQDAMLYCAASQSQTTPFGFELPLGAVVASADLVDCRIMNHSEEGEFKNSFFEWIDDQTPLELSLGLWQPGRYAWSLANVQRLIEPIPWRGGQGLRDAPLELQFLVAAAPKVDCEVPF
jgi:activating signal cointegrator 1